MTVSEPARPSAVTARAPAKINLTLDVFSKRADGYHSIASIFQAVSLHDTVTVNHLPEGEWRFTCDAPPGILVPVDETNLAHRAARAVMEAAGSAASLHIHLVKRIPSQAGLGGGSSDAAAALLAVDALLSLQTPPDLLRDLAASLGSDVPFFLTGGAATARGRGEILSPLSDLPQWWFVIVKPPQSVSTAWAYNALDSNPQRSSYRATARVQQAIEQQDWERVTAWQCNDFELPVFEAMPEIAWVHDELRMAGAVAAHLCGSGSAVYGLMPSESAARSAARLLRGRYPGVHVARSLTRSESHPLSDVPIPLEDPS